MESCERPLPRFALRVDRPVNQLRHWPYARPTKASRLDPKLFAPVLSDYVHLIFGRGERFLNAHLAVPD